MNVTYMILYISTNDIMGHQLPVAEAFLALAEAIKATSYCSFVTILLWGSQQVLVNPEKPEECAIAGHNLIG